MAGTVLAVAVVCLWPLFALAQTNKKIISGVPVYVDDSPPPPPPPPPLPGEPPISLPVTIGQALYRNEWILQLPRDWDDDKLNKFTRQLPAGVSVTSWPSKSGLAIVVLHCTLEGLSEVLRLNSGTVFVEQDKLIQAVPEIASHSQETSIAASTSRTASWGLHRIHQRYNSLTSSYDADAIGGQGVHVYVVDTGIRTTHTDFGGRAVPTLEVLGEKANPCSTTDTLCAQDKNGHGTHCAGTIGGERYGVAKGVTLHAVKVISDSGTGTYSWWMRALDWILLNGQRPAVVSMSLQGARPERSIGLKWAVDQVSANNIVVVVAAGNNNDDACNSAPAYIPSAIVVASTDRGDRKSSFSNHGMCVDLFAPGSDIVSAGVSSDMDSVSMSGTSMACPHVSGAAALLLGRTPTLSAPNTKQLLLASATKDNVIDPRLTPNRLLYIDDSDELTFSTHPPSIGPISIRGSIMAEKIMAERIWSRATTFSDWFPKTMNVPKQMLVAAYSLFVILALGSFAIAVICTRAQPNPQIVGYRPYPAGRKR